MVRFSGVPRNSKMTLLTMRGSVKRSFRLCEVVGEDEFECSNLLLVRDSGEGKDVSP